MSAEKNDARSVSLSKYKRLEDWSQRKPRLALMGEFSAGKSTLLNFLIEEEVLPTRATATELPPVWFSYGNSGSYWVGEDGDRNQITVNQLSDVPPSARYVRLFVEAEILEHCDVIDTPGISDPNLAVETWRVAAGYANMVMWCTSATQAWRQTERSAWLSLPERLRKHSILVVTRSDKLLTEQDRDKVARRMAREAEEYFAGTVFMSTPNAVQAKAELASGQETPLWNASGAGPLLDMLASRLEGIYEDKAALFSRYSVAEGQEKAQPAAPAATNEAPSENTQATNDQDQAPQKPPVQDTPAQAAPVQNNPAPVEPKPDAVQPVSEVSKPAVAEEAKPAAAAAMPAKPVAPPISANTPVAPQPANGAAPVAPPQGQPAAPQNNNTSDQQPQKGAPEAPPAQPVAAKVNKESVESGPVAQQKEAQQAVVAPKPPVQANPAAPSAPKTEAVQPNEKLAESPAVAPEKAVPAAPVAPKPPVQANEATTPSAPAVDAKPVTPAEAPSETVPQPQQTAQTQPTPNAAAQAQPNQEAAPSADNNGTPAHAAKPDGQTAGPDSTPATPASEEQAVAKQVELWREIVARSPDSPSNEQLISMIDELLQKVFGQAAGSNNLDVSQAQVAETVENTNADGKPDPKPGWRRLA